MGRTQKTKPPEDTDQWVEWADDIVAMTERTLEAYRTELAQVKKHLAGRPGKRRPKLTALRANDVDMRHCTGMLERMGHSFNMIMARHDMKATVARQEARPFELHDLVRIIPRAELENLRWKQKVAYSVKSGMWDAFKLVYKRGLSKDNDTSRLQAIVTGYLWDDMLAAAIAKRGLPEFPCPEYSTYDETDPLRVYRVEIDARYGDSHDKRLRREWANAVVDIREEEERKLLERYRPVFEALSLDVKPPDKRFSSELLKCVSITKMPRTNYHVADVHHNVVLIMADGVYWMVRTDVLEFAGE